MKERSYKVETPRVVVRLNRIHLRETNDPSPPSADAEVTKHFVPQSDQLQSSVSKKVTTPALSQEDTSSNY